MRSESKDYLAGPYHFLIEPHPVQVVGGLQDGNDQVAICLVSLCNGLVYLPFQGVFVICT